MSNQLLQESIQAAYEASTEEATVAPLEFHYHPGGQDWWSLNTLDGDIKVLKARIVKRTPKQVKVALLTRCRYRFRGKPEWWRILTFSTDGLAFHQTAKLTLVNDFALYELVLAAIREATAAIGKEWGGLVDYATLGVEADANQAEIKEAYRRAAMKYHPDRGGDPEQVRKVREAYSRLVV